MSSYMDKLKLQTHNIVDENIKKIAELFPNCLTERLDENGKPEVAIDFDMLRQELSKDIVEGPEERYQFTWPDKRNAIRLANAPTTDTLRPCREESIDFDNTQNLYIEGDNLEVLKLLRENYLGKVKMIYIDPPYNTGNDFVYNDDFAQTAGDYVHNSGQEDEEGNRLVANTESNGRFHTDWLNMIYPRLKVAKDLLSEDGVIFISIDDNELENLRRVCDEIFGAVNFVANFVWKSRQNKDNRNINGVSIDHEYILVYGRSNNCRLFKGEERSGKGYSNPDNDPLGPWTSANMAGIATESQRPNLHYDLIDPNTGINYGRPKMGWRYDKNTMAKLIAEGRILWPDNPDGRPRRKLYLNELDDNLPGFTSIIGANVYTRNGSNEIDRLFGTRLFSFPKPTALIEPLISQVTEKDSIVLDFFSGSATTAHAVMKLNAEDGGHRRFIMVQLPEETAERSEARKYDFKNICEIGKMRIKCASEEVVSSMKMYMKGWLAGTELVMKKHQKKEEQLSLLDQQKNEEIKVNQSQQILEKLNHRIESLDLGFRVLKLDSSNMQDVYYSPEQFNENLLFEDNIKHDRTDEDLLFQAMIELGIELSVKIEKREIAGKTVWSVADNYLMACFDKDVNETAITEIARQHPYYFVLRDASLATDNVVDNFEQIWEEYSKETVRRIL